MSALMNQLFGPLSKDYCMYFYYLSIFAFVSFLFIFVGGIVYGIQKRKGVGYFLRTAIIALPAFLNYFVLRLFYSMCSRT